MIRPVVVDRLPTKQLASSRLDRIEEWAALWGVPGLQSRTRVELSTRLRSSLGRAWPAKKLIRIHAGLIDHPREVIEEVLCHEAAHVAVAELHGGYRRPHGAEWRRLMKQAGFEPRVRLRLATPLADYAMPNLIFDVTGTADALGWERFHLVGHDWGAAVAWTVGVFAPDRLLTLNPISVPHPDGFNAERMNPDSCQFSASGYINDFVQPGFENVFLANNNALFRSIFEGVPPDAVDRHIELLGTAPLVRREVVPDADRMIQEWAPDRVIEALRALLDHTPNQE